MFDQWLKEEIHDSADGFGRAITSTNYGSYLSWMFVDLLDGVESLGSASGFVDGLPLIECERPLPVEFVRILQYGLISFGCNILCQMYIGVGVS